MNMKKLEINNRKDILLLMLYSPGNTDKVNEPITGRTRLIKMLFLFKEELWPKFRKGVDLQDEEMYNFIPWNYGPFSKDVYDDLTFFTLQKFIEISSSGEEIVLEEAAEHKYYIE